MAHFPSCLTTHTHTTRRVSYSLAHTVFSILTHLRAGGHQNTVFTGATEDGHPVTGVEMKYAAFSPPLSAFSSLSPFFLYFDLNSFDLPVTPTFALFGFLHRFLPPTSSLSFHSLPSPSSLPLLGTTSPHTVRCFAMSKRRRRTTKRASPTASQWCRKTLTWRRQPYSQR